MSQTASETERPRARSFAPALGRVLLAPGLALALALAARDAGAAQRAQTAPVLAEESQLCSERPPAERSTRSAFDLHCIEMYPTPAADGARGRIELGYVPSPFGVAVTPEGRHIYELTAWISGLPEPASIGPFGVFVAWAVTPDLRESVRLGPVRNGRNQLGRVAFNQFTVLISAERSAAVEERQGRLVLRGRSPSSRLEPADLLTQAPAAVILPGDDDPAMDTAESGRRAGDHGAADHGAGEQDGGDAAGHREGGWRMPPGYPGLAMLPGMRRLQPAVRPWTQGVDPEDLPEARPRRIVDLPDGGTLDLEAGWVRRRIGGRTLAMYAFNGQHPGPLIRVPARATITVNFTNRTSLPTTVHWHGVRLDNRFDGVPGVTQPAVLPGETFRYRIYFRDAGVYWYHPHHREDLQQELGLYGNMLVEPPPEHDYNPVNREETLMLDDLLLDEQGVVPFGRESSNYALMGRFGNVFLINGEPGHSLDVDRGAVVRFFLTNASNTRTFNLSFVPSQDREPLPIKVVGSDLGKFEREERVRNVVLAPAERYIVEVRFDRAGTVRLMNRVQAIDHLAGAYFPEYTTLGTVTVSDRPVADDHGAAFDRLREHPEVVHDIDRYRRHFDGPPDRELALTLRVEDLPAVIEQVMAYDWIFFNPVEWAGTMPMMNWATTGREVRWVLRDVRTGRENMDIDWRLRVGDVVRVRIRNERDAFHAMQHPIHIHGQRFLVLRQNGVANENLVWKDTVLLPVGSTTDILLELSNPGRWMIHCHIAEHLEAGMSFVMDVE